MARTISPLVTIVTLLKDVELNDFMSEAQQEEALEDSDTIAVEKTMIWSDLINIEKATDKVEKMYLKHDVYCVMTHNSDTFYAIIKDIKDFLKSWETYLIENEAEA